MELTNLVVFLGYVPITNYSCRDISPHKKRPVTKLQDKILLLKINIEQHKMLLALVTSPFFSC